MDYSYHCSFLCHLLQSIKQLLRNPIMYASSVADESIDTLEEVDTRTNFERAKKQNEVSN